MIKVTDDAPEPPAEDLMLAAVCNCLGRTLHIVPATAHHRMHVIVRLGRAFELYDIKGCHFDCLLNLLRVFLMCLRERFWLCYQRLFRVHHPEVYMEELYTVTYRLLTPASNFNMFLVYIPRAQLTQVKKSFHLVASSFEARSHYLNFGDVYKME